MTQISLAEASNTEGAMMRFAFAPTRSWQAFSVQGLPSRLASMDGKSLSLGKAVQIWNVSISKRSDALAAATVSATIRKRIDEARDARAAAARSTPAPIF